MKLFTNTTKTRLFATDNHVKNLEAIEITGVAQATENWGHSVFNLKTLLDQNYLATDDLDQLIVIPVASMGLEPVEPPSDTLTIDFTGELTYAQIAAEVLGVYDYYGKTDVIDELKSLWRYQDDYRGDNQSYVFTASDGSQLHIEIDHFEEVMVVSTRTPSMN